MLESEYLHMYCDPVCKQPLAKFRQIWADAKSLLSILFFEYEKRACQFLPHQVK